MQVNIKGYENLKFMLLIWSKCATVFQILEILEPHLKQVEEKTIADHRKYGSSLGKSRIGPKKEKG